MRRATEVMMRISLSLGLYLASTHMAVSQDLRAVPENEPMPAAISASVQAAFVAEDVLHAINRWEANLVGDATPDLLVEAVYSPNGGNGVYADHWIFVGAAGGFSSYFPIEIPGAILIARIEGNDLVFTLPRLKPGEPRCCPTGSAVHRMALN
jgi:hypothetical protein